MRTFTFLALSYLLTAVWAGGYQGCLERVWIYQAYLIDQLNAPDHRTLGFKCEEDDIDRATGECRVPWKACGSKSNPGGPCTYDEFYRTLGRGPSEKTWRVPETGPLDAEATAKKCYEKEVKFNSLIERVKDIVNKAYREHRTADNVGMWDREFDETTDKIVTARIGDHGPYLLAEAAEKLDGWTLIKQDLGPNPVADPPKNWETLDWTATEEEAKRSGVADAEEKLKAFRTTFYTTNGKAKDHKAVIDKYEEVQASKLTCR